MHDPAPAARAWYREPWFWMLMAGPGAVIIAAFVTVVLALRSDDGVVAEDYYRQGLAINRVLERDRRARELGIAAVAELSGARVRIRVSGTTADSAELRLRLVHPTRSGEDREAALVSHGGGLYVGEFTGAPVPAGAQRRRLVLEDRLGGWRITGVLNRAEIPVRLEAAP